MPPSDTKDFTTPFASQRIPPKKKMAFSQLSFRPTGEISFAPLPRDFSFHSK